ncbi:MAG: hypothetical protein ACK4LA_07355, partial [Aquificaceae bacterium]
IVKDILPISEILRQGLNRYEQRVEQKQEPEEIQDPLETLKGKLDLLTFEVLKRSKYEVREGKVIFHIREKDLTQEERNKIKAINPRIEFVIEKEERKEGSLPPFAEKVKDLFGAKVISHEKRDKGKDASGKGS